MAETRTQWRIIEDWPGWSGPMQTCGGAIWDSITGGGRAAAEIALKLRMSEAGSHNPRLQSRVVTTGTWDR